MADAKKVAKKDVSLGTLTPQADAPPDEQGGFIQTSGQIVSTQNADWQQEVRDKSPQGKFGGA